MFGQTTHYATSTNQGLKTKIENFGKLLRKRHKSVDGMLALKVCIHEIRSLRELLASTKEAYKKGEMN